jgi:glycosyltransferase involved in cell wall biosynthesis
MRKTLSVALITLNEAANLERTLESVRFADEIVIVDSGSTDRTVPIAEEFGARVFHEPWKGFAAQKNSALSKCSSDWTLSLDADEEVSQELAASIQKLLADRPEEAGYRLRRRNHFLGRWMRHGGYYPDPKLRLFPSGSAYFEARPVHEAIRLTSDGKTKELSGDLIHHCYAGLDEYIEHMNRYSRLGAVHTLENGLSAHRHWLFTGVLLNPVATFVYNYLLRGGFLDGPEGLLQHLYHSAYISWKYAKAWQISRDKNPSAKAAAHKAANSGRI